MWRFFAGTSERWCWEQSTNRLFTEMIQMFVKLKVESSGFPKGIETEMEKKAFAAEMSEMLNTELKVEDIKYNGGLRCVSKTSINSVRS